MKTKATAITTAASFADIWANIGQLIADETGLLHNYRFFTGAKKYRKKDYQICLQQKMAI